MARKHIFIFDTPKKVGGVNLKPAKNIKFKMLQLPFSAEYRKQKSYSISNNNGVKEEVLIYFDTNELGNGYIARAILLLEIFRRFESDTGISGIKYALNSSPLTEKYMTAMEQNQGIYPLNSNEELDITEGINKIISGESENNGIILSCNEGQARFYIGKGSKLLIRQEPPVIVPVVYKDIDNRTNERVFFEKEFRITANNEPKFTPTLATFNSRVITFFFENLGKNPVICFIQYSPDAHIFGNDNQIIKVDPGELGKITPVTFSKYMRAAVHAENEQPITARIWFHTQLYILGNA